jgi:hypothetical protein
MKRLLSFAAMERISQIFIGIVPFKAAGPSQPTDEIQVEQIHCWFFKENYS